MFPNYHRGYLTSMANEKLRDSFSSLFLRPEPPSFNDIKLPRLIPVTELIWRLILFFRIVVILWVEEFTIFE